MKSLAVLYIQLALCAVLLISAYLITVFGGDFYSDLSSSYRSYLNATVLVDDKNVH